MRRLHFSVIESVHLHSWLLLLLLPPQPPMTLLLSGACVQNHPLGINFSTATQENVSSLRHLLLLLFDENYFGTSPRPCILLEPLRSPPIPVSVPVHHHPRHSPATLRPRPRRMSSPFRARVRLLPVIAASVSRFTV